MKDGIIVICPHCKDSIWIFKKELNCHIFRHGVFKKNLEQINPHGSKTYCDNLYKNKLIYGCGKPFRIIVENDKYDAIICDYI